MIKKVAFNGFADVSSVLAGILSSVVLARSLGPDQWGIYSQLLWLIGFSSTFLSFGLTYAAVRFLGVLSGRIDAHETRTLALWICLLQFALAVSGCLIFFVCAEQIVIIAQWKIDPAFVRLSSINLFAITMNQIFISIFRGLQKFHVLSVFALLSNTVLIIGTVATLFRPSVGMLIIIVGFGQILLLPLMLLVLRRELRLDIGLSLSGLKLPENWRSILGYSAVIFITVLADQIVWQRSEIFFLAQLGDPRESGYYGLAYTITLLAIGTLPAAITGVLTPLFSSLAGSTNGFSELARSYQNSFAFLNLIVLPTSMGLFVIAPHIIALLYGEAYVAASTVLRILILSAALSIYARPSASVIHALNRPYILLFGNIVAIPVNLFLAWRLVPLWGAKGAAIANVAAQLIGASVAIGYTTVVVRLRYDHRSLIKSFVGACACSGVAWLMDSLLIPSIPNLFLTVIFSASIYVLALIGLRDRPAQEAMAWICGRAVRSMSMLHR